MTENGTICKKEALRPCRYCCKETRLIVEKQKVYAENFEHWVTCVDCRARGPVGSTDQEAVTLHNSE